MTMPNRVLGIDPGSRITGYGLVDQTPGGLTYVASGCIRISGEEFPQRLKQIFDGIDQVVAQYQPNQMAIEQVFMHKNADSAIKLGQARGAAICAVLARAVPVSEYAARQIKQALVGKGNADKVQVQHMVKILLGLQGKIQTDAGDALGVALCHIHHAQTERRLARLGVGQSTE